MEQSLKVHTTGEQVAFELWQIDAIFRLTRTEENGEQTWARDFDDEVQARLAFDDAASA